MNACEYFLGAELWMSIVLSFPSCTLVISIHILMLPSPIFVLLLAAQPYNRTYWNPTKLFQLACLTAMAPKTQANKMSPTW